MELAHLRYAVKLSETANYSKAAEALFITQPALSQQIRALEEELGLKLFERTTRRVILTPAGEEFVRRAMGILQQVDELESSMEHRRMDMRNTLSVGLLGTLSHLNIPEVIRGFQTQYPNIHVKLQIGLSVDLISRVKQGELDAAITNIYCPENEVLDRRLDVEVFLEDVIVALCSRQNPLCGQKDLTLEQLLDQPVLALDDHTSIQMQINDIFAHYSCRPQIVCTCPNTDSLCSMVEANVGIAFLSSLVARTHDSEKLAILPFRPLHHTQSAIVTNSGRPMSYTLRLFRDYLRGILHNTV